MHFPEEIGRMKKQRDVEKSKSTSKKSKTRKGREREKHDSSKLREGFRTAIRTTQTYLLRYQEHQGGKKKLIDKKREGRRRRRSKAKSR